MEIRSILWRNLDMPGYESCRLTLLGSRWQLAGTAVSAHLQEPCRLDYLVVCGPDWRTESAKVSGWIGSRSVNIQVAADGKRRWVLNGAERPEAAGCIDLDLGFSPSTNLLSIRRLGLAVGQSAEVRAALLRFPDFVLEPATQLYRRLDESTYRFESDGGRFAADLKVDPNGFVTSYSGLWQAEAVSWRNADKP